jgi:hypothetical protein
MAVRIESAAMSLIRLRVGRSFPLLGIVTLSAFAGCASSTIIDTRPTGARIFLDGAPMGTTPYTMTDTKIVSSSTQVRLEHPGYETLNLTISRSEELDVLPLIGGIFLLVPFLWVMKYHPTHYYELQPASGARPTAPQSAPPAAYPPPPAGYPPPAR